MGFVDTTSLHDAAAKIDGGRDSLEDIPGF
jgi:hypothetical protein